jgi:hypothetical protein
MNENYRKGFDAGVKIACANLGITPEEAVRHSAFSDKYLSDLQMQTDICKIAAACFKAAGMTSSVEFHLYDTMAKSASTLSPVSVEKFLVPVVKSLHKQAKLLHEELMEKSASGGVLGGLLSKVFGAASGTIPDLYKMYALLGAGAGTATGALTWYLNRDASEDSAEVEAKIEQAKHYKQIAKDIKKRLKLEKDPKKKKSIEDSAEEQGEGAFIL